ncbi:fructose 1,6-bisphosphatase [Nanoarchaeota archaeon NZ13-N]|uniref:Fructose-1,6-bisphosphate aldolase/phosphatase n=1 Tax=Candidatus Nanoclepta minutus TaxID=1940235 RepID=A0A397WPS9_9ARCH|nr:MAG: fructose 1,6-bisphosphatase [Nanoarchaeota archaeon NZ13-N]RIB35557.1 MAG: fructose 1,6-bisphosphatase [Candidatus Nanoclepta minutus]
MGERVTISVIKADVGGLVGHHVVHPALEETAEGVLEEVVDELIYDYFVTHVGDDLVLIMTHGKGEDNSEIHGLAWKAFQKAAKVAKELGLYGAGQDLLSEAFSGNVKGLGPGVAEMSITERPSEPVIVFAADKTEAGAWNLPLFKMFADPFNTAGLIIDPSMHQGFRFEVWDLVEHKKVELSCPEEMYDLLALIGSPGRFAIKRVYPKQGSPIDPNEPVAVASTERLYEIAGRYVGKDDPVLVVRAQHGLPAVGEVLEAFAFPHLVAGWMRGSHWGPLMPVPLEYAAPTRFDGPPRVIGLGFQIKDGRLIGPEDMFADPAFDYAREMANKVADYMRRHGPFEPHRVSYHDLEYTSMPAVLEKLKDRFRPLE